MIGYRFYLIWALNPVRKEFGFDGKELLLFLLPSVIFPCVGWVLGAFGSSLDHGTDFICAHNERGDRSWIARILARLDGAFSRNPQSVSFLTYYCGFMSHGGVFSVGPSAGTGHEACHIGASSGALGSR